MTNTYTLCNAIFNRETSKKANTIAKPKSKKLLWIRIAIEFIIFFIFAYLIWLIWYTYYREYEETYPVELQIVGSLPIGIEQKSIKLYSHESVMLTGNKHFHSTAKKVQAQVNLDYVVSESQYFEVPVLINGEFEQGRSKPENITVLGDFSFKRTRFVIPFNLKGNRSNKISIASTFVHHRNFTAYIRFKIKDDQTFMDNSYFYFLFRSMPQTFQRLQIKDSYSIYFGDNGVYFGREYDADKNQFVTSTIMRLGYDINGYNYARLDVINDTFTLYFKNRNEIIRNNRIQSGMISLGVQNVFATGEVRIYRLD